jgi:hypothetical protein
MSSPRKCFHGSYLKRSTNYKRRAIPNRDATAV